jgi:hypothetical protein
LHDLRRTFATYFAALGAPIHVTEKLLNHASGSASGVAAISSRLHGRDAGGDRQLGEAHRRNCRADLTIVGLRIPTKPATHSNRKPATDSDLKPAGVPI